MQGNSVASELDGKVVHLFCGASSKACEDEGRMAHHNKAAAEEVDAV